MLSKLTTQSVGTPSTSACKSSTDMSPRRVRVSAATTTEPIRAATGSRVSTRTGWSPPGVAANQMSPRCISPVSPVLGRTPDGYRRERPFTVIKRLFDPGHGVVFTSQPQQVMAKRLAQQLRTVDSQPRGPRLNSLSVLVGHPKTQHCHTDIIRRMTLGVCEDPPYRERTVRLALAGYRASRSTAWTPS